MSPVELRHATALKWFEIHASQRMQLLAGYLAGMGFISGGIGAALSQKMPTVASILAILLAILTAVFDRLDNRTKQLIKVAERALSESLREADPDHTADDIVTMSERKDSVPSYRDSFLILYAASYIFAFVAIVICWIPFS